MLGVDSAYVLFLFFSLQVLLFPSCFLAIIYKRCKHFPLLTIAVDDNLILARLVICYIFLGFTGVLPDTGPASLVTPFFIVAIAVRVGIVCTIDHVTV